MVEIFRIDRRGIPHCADFGRNVFCRDTRGLDLLVVRTWGAGVVRLCEEGAEPKTRLCEEEAEPKTLA